MAQQKISKQKFPRGSALVFTLIILSVMLVAAIGISSVSVMERKNSSSTGKSTSSFQVADSGAEIILQKKKTAVTINDLVGGGVACDSEGTLTGDISGKKYAITMYDKDDHKLNCTNGSELSNKIAKIKSAGSYAGTSRAVEVSVCSSFLGSALAKPPSSGQADAQAIYVRGNYAYVGGTDVVGSRGLYIFNISDPNNPALLSFFLTEGTLCGWGEDDVLDVYVSGNYAYLATYFGGLVVVDISNPNNPQLKGKLALPGQAWAVDVKGDYAYIADYANGLQIVNVADPANPTLVKTVDALEVGGIKTPAHAVYVEGDYAYIGAWAPDPNERNAFYIVHIADIPNAHIEGSYSEVTPGVVKVIKGVYIQGNYAYVGRVNVTANTSELLVFDISNKSNPLLVGTYGKGGIEVYISDGKIYLADGEGGVHIYDISSDPRNPVYRETISLPAGKAADDVWASGGKIYMADSMGGGLQILKGCR